MNRFQITAEIATTVWLGTAESYKYKPNRVHFRDIYKIDDAEIYATSYEEFEKRLTPFAWEIKKEFLRYLFECADGEKFNVQSVDVSLPLGSTVYITALGNLETYSVGSFDAVVELEGSNDYANKFIKDALNTTLDVVSKSIHDFISFRVSYLNVREIRE